jgi:catechol 2,3-dioxygenase-like lactoylglutathione lyase family enzyme
MRLHPEMSPSVRVGRAVLAATAIVALVAALPPVSAAPPAASRLSVSSVGAIGLTVADMTRAIDFYTRVLPFRPVADVMVHGREFELLTGVFGARARVVTIALGDERLELTEFLAPRGRPYPADTRANDRWFQHVAIIVPDMARAYAHLAAHGVPHASTSPQRLPDWNPNAGGIEAFYFRDPDGHFLEILAFPDGKGDPRWKALARRDDRLFLGIDHTAIVSGDTDRSLEFYRDLAGLRVAGASTNHGLEQEHLNNVFGARLRITTLRADAGPAVELLEYLAPRDGRPAPVDLRSNDVAHWHTTLVGDGLEALFEPSLSRLLSLVSPSVVSQMGGPLGFEAGILVRDPDGHGVRVTRR